MLNFLFSKNINLLLIFFENKKFYEKLDYVNNQKHNFE